MKAKLNILMVFPEVAPFARTGEIGDVGGALPKALKDMGHDVRVITPQYRSINERKYVLRDVIRLQNIDIKLGSKKVTIDVKSAFIPNSKVQVYFIDYKPFFFREGLYSNASTGKSFPDNDKRFILFSKGALKTLNKLQWQPDVIHCNDWQSGLIPFFLKTIYKDDPFFKKTFTLFTVHDLNSQGDFDRQCFDSMAEGEDTIFPEEEIQHNGRVSFLKAGIVYADSVNTIRENYSQKDLPERTDQDLLKEVSQWRKDKIHHIANGIDYSIWNPESDSLIQKSYTLGDLKDKEENRRALLENQGLPFVPDVPIVGILSDFSDQAGLDLLRTVLDDMMKMNIYFIFLGNADKSLLQFLKKNQKKYTKRFSIISSDDDALVHLFVAGTDILLFPSVSRAMETSRFFCLKYGTVPVVFKPKGMTDTIQPFNANTGKGVGFDFQDHNARQLVNTVKKAVRTYGDQKIWLKIMKNSMREDFSWQHSSKRYVQFYNKCIAKRK